MMEMQNIAPKAGSNKKIKRLGRGIGSGHGKTCCKGHKGQWARSGGGVRPGFEGGQMPLIRRVPKRGFTNRYKKIYTIVNISDLEKFDNGTNVDAAALLNSGIASKIEKDGVKVLGQGKLTKKLTVKAEKFSEKAVEAITAAGGKVEIVE
jgi:large subunit ribosomal protein L15